MSFYDVIEKYRDFDFDGYLNNVIDNDVLRSLLKDKFEDFDILNLFFKIVVKYLEDMV